jgi:hypothetical protein
MRHAGAAVLQPLGRAIRRRRHDRTSGAARDHLRGKVVDRHAAASPGSVTGASIVPLPLDSPFRDVAAGDV